jgi:hypothetical protein
VVVTNTSGTFSNANWTGTPDGGFAISLGSPTDTYVEYIEPATLPADATVAQPVGGIYTFTLGPNNQDFMGNFLISSVLCSSNTPPPPPPPTNSITCCLHGSGSICGGHRKPEFVFAGSAVPACSSTNGDSGEWEVLDCRLRLRFQGSVFEIVNCGQDQDAASNTFHFIEFQGAGTLKGYGGCKANAGLVYFFAHAEDHGHCCASPDELYFRVYAADDTTLLLIGGDSINPTNVVPIPLSAGCLRIGTNCCESTSQSGNEGEQGHHGNGSCDRGSGKGGDDQGSGDDKGNHGRGNGNGNSDKNGTCNGDNGNSNHHHSGGDNGEDHGSGNGKNDQGSGNSNGSCNPAHGIGSGHSNQGEGNGHGGGHGHGH